jgi:hydrogenase expression/formation protein HypE
MGRGEIDGIVITTTGIGMANPVVTDCGLSPGDAIVITGTIGDHGLAVMSKRHKLDFENSPRSDVAPINRLVAMLLHLARGEVTAMKDPTRGGVASALHEMAEKSGVGIELDERSVPVRPEVRAVAELLGIDPLHVANEGKAIFGVRPDAVGRIVAALRGTRDGNDATVIGRCVADHPGAIVVDTGLGRRLLVEAEGELLPRIC